MVNQLNEFERLHEVLHSSGCDKLAVAAGTYVGGAFVMRTNDCKYVGDTCPRLDMPTGEGYDLCKSTHAEQRLFDFLDRHCAVSRGIVWVVGHYYVCEPCARNLRDRGVKEFRVEISK